MMVTGFDLETHLIKAGCIAPRMVCLSWHDGENQGLLDRKEGIAWFERQLDDRNVRLVAHHAFFDLAVLCAEKASLLPKVFHAIDEGRITCTKIRQMMIDNADGSLKFIEDEKGDLRAQDFSLAALSKRHLNKYVAKGADTFRLRYNELDGVPIEKWPEAASKYAIQDAVLTRQVYMAQEKGEEAVDHREIGQIQAAWALYLMGMWGIRTERVAVEKLRNELQAEVARLQKQLIPTGFVREDGTRDMKAIRARVEQRFAELGEKVPLTEGKQTSTDKDALTRTGDKNLLEVSDYVHTGKLLTTYVPVLFQGTEIPINASFNPILETFRTSCRGPNLQNLPRKGDVRGCFVSRGNTVFVTCDYDTLEMRTLAQTYLDLIGPSPLAEALKQGLDPHLSLAADLLGITEEEAARRYEAGDKEVENARQFGKIGNFGFPGGLSALTFVDYARTSYGKEVSPELAQRLHKTFRTRWKMEPYFRHCSGLTGPDVAERLEFPRSGLVRGRVPYTAVCNSYFQHLAAMGAKDALYHVSKECYLGGSPLAGSRPVVFLHDEILMEVPYGDPVKASAAADRLQQVMIERMSHWVPDIPIKATPGMMKRWTKGVKPVRQDGVLVPSKPVKKGDDKIVWEADL